MPQRRAILDTMAGSLKPSPATLTATSGDIVRAEPVDAIELEVAELFGDEAD
jgi:hypothetical protein